MKKKSRLDERLGRPAYEISRPNPSSAGRQFRKAVPRSAAAGDSLGTCRKVRWPHGPQPCPSQRHLAFRRGEADGRYCHRRSDGGCARRELVGRVPDPLGGAASAGETGCAGTGDPGALSYLVADTRSLSALITTCRLILSWCIRP